MRQYDEYKDTGIEWLSKLPSHWQLEQLRKYIRQVSKKGYPEKQLLSVTREQGVIVRDTESRKKITTLSQKILVVISMLKRDNS